MFRVRFNIDEKAKNENKIQINQRFRLQFSRRHQIRQIDARIFHIVQGKSTKFFTK
jgi:hypothetical protein